MSNKSKKIFITGGTGFVGSYLIAALINKGYKNITALKRQKSRTELIGNLEAQVNWIEGDILNVLDLEEQMRGSEWVFHCAAVVSHDPRDSEKMKHINAGGTANVVNACLESGVQKLIYTSSIAALNRVKNSKILDEESYWTPDSPVTSKYGLSKYLAEQEVWRGAAEGLSVAISNPSVIIGSGYWNSPTPRFFKMVQKGLHFYPEGSTGFVDIRDVVKGLILLAESEIQNERFIFSGENLTYLDFFSTIAEALQRKPPKIKIPQQLALVGAHGLYPIYRILGKNSPLPVDTARVTGFLNSYNSRKSRDILGLNYTPIAETIRQTADMMLLAKKRNWKPEMLPISFQNY